MGPNRLVNEGIYNESFQQSSSIYMSNTWKQYYKVPSTIAPGLVKTLS